MGNQDELLIKIRADIKGVEQNFRKAQAQVNGLKKSVDKASASMRSAGLKMTAVSGVMGLLFAQAVRTGASFEQSMKNVQSVAGATAEEFNRLSDFAKYMGETTVFSASQAAGAMYDLASAGFSTDEIISALEGTIALAAATGSDLTFAAETMTSTLKIFGLEADQAGRVADVFAMSISASKMNLDKLSVAMTYAGPVMAAFGWSVEASVAALSMFADIGLESSMIGTALRMGMLKLSEAAPIRPVLEGAEVLKRLGITAQEVNPEINDLGDIIKAFEGKTISMSDAVALFGVRAAGPFYKVISQGSKGFNTLTERLETASMSLEDLETLLATGAITQEEYNRKITDVQKSAQMMAIQLDSVQGAMRLLKSAIEGIQIAIFDELKDDIRGVQQGFVDAMPTVKHFALFFVQELVPMLKTFGGLVLNLMQQFNALSTSQKEQVVKFGAIAMAVAAVGGPMLILAGVTLPGLSIALKAVSSMLGVTAAAMYRVRTANLATALSFSVLQARVLSLTRSFLPLLAVAGALKAGEWAGRFVTKEDVSLLEATKEVMKATAKSWDVFLKTGKLITANEAYALVLADEKLQKEKELTDAKREQVGLTAEQKELEKEIADLKEQERKDAEELRKAVRASLEAGEDMLKEKKLSMKYLKQAVGIHNRLLGYSEDEISNNAELNAQQSWANSMLATAAKRLNELMNIKLTIGNLTKEETTEYRSLVLYIDAAKARTEEFSDSLAGAGAQADALTSKAADLARKAREYMLAIGAAPERTEQIVVPTTLEGAKEAYGSLGEAVYNTYWGIRTETEATAAAVQDKFVMAVDSVKQSLQNIDAYNFPNYEGNLAAGAIDPTKKFTAALQGVLDKLNAIDGKTVTVHYQTAGSWDDRRGL